MSKKEDGGSAFPYGGGSDGPYPGMTLRDWFAGQALNGLLAGLDHADCGPSGYAHDAYTYADAMLKVREVERE